MRHVVGSKTYTLETLRGDALKDNSNQDLRVSGEELVKVEIPALDFGLDEQQLARLEVQSDTDQDTVFNVPPYTIICRIYALVETYTDLTH